MITIIKKIEEARQFLVLQGCNAPESGLIPGSGLGELAEEIESTIVIPYEKIPNRGKPTVAGHVGQLTYGDLGGHKVIALQGRFHLYEGNPMELVTFSVRTMKALGYRGLTVTNTADGIGFGPGTLMAVLDHINTTGQNPLVGANLDDFRPRFPDMSDTHTTEYRDTTHKIVEKINIKLDGGVYLGVSGPCYETSAEIRAFQILGTNTVGISTAPEVIVAAHSDLKVLGISATINHVAGFQSPLNHEEVVAATQQIKEDLKTLVKVVLAEL